MNGYSNTLDALTGDGSVVTDGATLGVGYSNGGGTFSGVISGSGGLSKYGGNAGDDWTITVTTTYRVVTAGL